ncbi:MAG: homocysteine S-methyltransferase family protein [Candidatus Hydrogenedentes bacterium]|nr:homocysteine S-methyltransferase family protein [Candidatus Hydrogenedentota bacterium]
MNSIREDLAAKGVLISDGGWGSFLIAKGLQVGECPERWNLDHREDVIEVARSYVAAGVDLVSTNSFGANRFRLAHFGLEGQVAELNASAAAISREAMGATGHVHASIGPTGEMLMLGTVTEEELYEAFAAQAIALEQGGADAVCIETFADVQEASAAIRAVKQRTKLEIICTFTFQRGPAGNYNTMMGTTPEAMAEAVLAAGADIIGTNCTLGPAEMIDLVRTLHAAAPGVPLLVQPNAGQPIPDGGRIRYPETPESMAAYVPQFLEAGANILGGCCGTTPDHIRAIKAAAGR